MKIIEDCIDIGAPEFAVTGTAEIERISGGQIRIAYYSHRAGQNVITHYAIWDAEAFERVQSKYRQFRTTENRDKFVEVN